MALKVGELFGVLGLDSTGFDKGMDSANKKFGLSESAMQNLKDKAITGLGVGLTGLGAASFKFSNDFNASMANVASLIPGNTARVKELAGAVQSMSMSTGKATGDISTGLYQVISAFGDTSSTVKQLEINVKAAAAGVASTADAINLTSAVTKAYGDTSTEAVQKVSDLALLTVRLGQTTFPELAASIGQVTPLTKALGVSQEELFGTMATATGVTGNAAAVSTQLRGVMQGLMAPTESMSKLFEANGVASGEAMIKQFGLQGTINKIVEAAKASGAPLQDYLGSIEGQTLALALAGPQAENLTNKINEMGKSAGTTNEAYKEQTEGINKMGFTWSRVTAIGTVFLQKMGNVSPIIMMVGSMVTMVGTLKDMGVAFNMEGLAAAKAWVLTLGPIALVIAGIAAVGTAVWLVIKYWDNIAAFFGKVWDGIKAAFKWGLDAIIWYFKWFTPQGLIISQWEPIVNFFKNLWANVWDATTSGFGRTMDWIRDKLGIVGDFFKNLYNRVVGHSIVPDMISGIQGEMEKLGGVAMVTPVVKAADAATSAFQSVGGTGTMGATGTPGAGGDSMQALIKLQMQTVLELQKLTNAGAVA